MANAMQREIDDLREQVENLTTLLKSKAKSAANAAHKAVDEKDNIINLSADDLARMAKKTGKQARAFVEHKLEDAEEVVAEVEEKINDNPMQAVMIAAASGLFLGMLMKK